jgi:thioredoxin-like negative regulator of GroEL
LCNFVQKIKWRGGLNLGRNFALLDFVQDVTSEWDIRAMPTFLFIKDGKQVDRIVGANKDELDKKVQHYASLVTA